MSSASNSEEENDYKLAKLFVMTVRQFFESTSLHGFKYLVQPGRSTFEKLLWYFIQICALLAAIYIFLQAFNDFESKPTFTSLESVNHPIWEISFPAVAVCPINKISKKAAMQYAIELSNKTQNHSVDWLFENIRYLGHVFDYDIEYYNDYIKFQDLLDVIDQSNISMYDTQDKFEFKISPQCEDIFLRCQWIGKQTDCMSLFKFRKTTDGYCCLANYVRQFNTLSSTEDVKHPNKSSFVGPSAGMTFVLNTTTSDYYFPLGDSIGFIVYVFSADDYVDNQNGGFVKMLLNPDVEAFFKLKPTTIDSKPATEQYSPVQRGCLFDHELFEQYAGHYSYVDCLLKCKLRSIIAFCGCMPFFLPTNFPDGTVTPVKCTLAHNLCLHRYKNIFNSFWTPNIEATELERQRFTEESIDCLECLPKCSKTSYRVTATYSRLFKEAMEKSHSALLENLSTFNDISVVHIYYPYSGTTLFRADVVLTWQEIVSNFGGLLGLCLGFSLVNFVEIGYFATVRLYQNIPSAYSNRKNQNQRKSIKRIEPYMKKHADDMVILSKIRLRDMYVNDFGKYHRQIIQKR